MCWYIDILKYWYVERSLRRIPSYWWLLVYLLYFYMFQNITLSFCFFILWSMNNHNCGASVFCSSNFSTRMTRSGKWKRESKLTVAEILWSTLTYCSFPANIIFISIAEVLWSTLLMYCSLTFSHFLLNEQQQMSRKSKKATKFQLVKNKFFFHACTLSIPATALVVHLKTEGNIQLHTHTYKGQESSVWLGGRSLQESSMIHKASPKVMILIFKWRFLWFFELADGQTTGVQIMITTSGLDCGSVEWIKMSALATLFCYLWRSVMLLRCRTTTHQHCDFSICNK